MNTHVRNRLYRIILAITAFGLLVLSVPITVQAAPEKATAKTYFIEITAVEKNKTITVKATGFPTDTDFRVRVGPFQDFRKQAVDLGTVDSGSKGSFTFNVTLPKVVKDVKLVTVRLDSAKGHYSYNVFSNADLGKIAKSPDAWLPSTPPAPTPTPVVTTACRIVSTQPTLSMKVRSDFDAVWTLKNNGTTTWDKNSIDYRYRSGEKIYKRGSAYDLPKSVKPGETIKIVVDMVAPAKAGTYKTEWILGNLCSLPLTITVK